MAPRKVKTVQIGSETIRKPSGIKKDGTVNVPWRKFKEKLDSFESVPLVEWKAEQILGYILKLYQEHFDVEYSLSYSGPPSKCSEIYCVKRMLTVLGSENPMLAKDFIDWSYTSVIVPKKLPIKSLAFFFTATLIREFKAKFKKASRITRATQLPKNIEEYAVSIGLDSIVTYGDMAFVKKATDSDPENEDYVPYFKLFVWMNHNGFDFDVLEHLEG